MKILHALSAFLVVLAVAARGVGQDAATVWPQFRGPGGSGVADAENPPVEIGPEKNVKWKVAVPAGVSSPIVVGDLLVITAFEDDKLYTIAPGHPFQDPTILLPSHTAENPTSKTPVTIHHSPTDLVAADGRAGLFAGQIRS